MSQSTTSQTVGPFYSIGLDYRNAPRAKPGGLAPGVIEVCGQILDGENQPVPDAVLEFWHADPDGHYAGAGGGEPSVREHFQGFLRVAPNDRGIFCFQITRPGSVVNADGTQQAPHIVVMIFMRGLLRHLHTRIYFADDSRCQHDWILLAAPAGRRHTLLAIPEKDQAGRYRWDIHLQGEDETVFFAY